MGTMLEEIESARERSRWKRITECVPPHGIPVLFWRAEWVDPDYCLNGIVEGHRNDDLGYVSFHWDAGFDILREVTGEDPTHWRFQPNPPAPSEL